MADIVDIGGTPSTRSNTVNAEVVKCITELLERAKSGAIQQIAFVVVDGTGRPVDGYAPGGHPDELIPIIGGLELCKATLLAQMI